MISVVSGIHELDRYSKDKLIDYLENNGYEVYQKDHVLSYFDTSDLVSELSDRGQYYSGMTDDEIKEEAESRGFYVTEHETDKELLHDIHRHAAWMNAGQFRQYINDLFIKYINKWI